MNVFRTIAKPWRVLGQQVKSSYSTQWNHPYTNLKHSFRVSSMEYREGINNACNNTASMTFPRVTCISINFDSPSLYAKSFTDVVNLIYTTISRWFGPTSRKSNISYMMEKQIHEPKVVQPKDEELHDDQELQQTADKKPKSDPKMKKAKRLDTAELEKDQEKSQGQPKDVERPEETHKPKST